MYSHWTIILVQCDTRDVFALLIYTQILTLNRNWPTGGSAYGIPLNATKVRFAYMVCWVRPRIRWHPDNVTVTNSPSLFCWSRMASTSWIAKSRCNNRNPYLHLLFLVAYVILNHWILWYRVRTDRVLAYNWFETTKLYVLFKLFIIFEIHHRQGR